MRASEALPVICRSDPGKNSARRLLCTWWFLKRRAPTRSAARTLLSISESSKIFAYSHAPRVTVVALGDVGTKIDVVLLIQKEP